MLTSADLQDSGASTNPVYGNPLNNTDKAKLQAEAIANVKATLARAGEDKAKAESLHFRQAAGKKWVDPTLSEWREGAIYLFMPGCMTWI